MFDLFRAVLRVSAYGQYRYRRITISSERPDFPSFQVTGGIMPVVFVSRNGHVTLGCFGLNV